MSRLAELALDDNRLNNKFWDSIKRNEVQSIEESATPLGKPSDFFVNFYKAGKGTLKIIFSTAALSIGKGSDWNLKKDFELVRKTKIGLAGSVAGYMTSAYVLETIRKSTIALATYDIHKLMRH